MQVPLNNTASAVFVANPAPGTGTIARAIMQPIVVGTSWHITRIMVTATGNTASNVLLRLYLNGESQSNLIDGTFRGERDVSETELDLATLDRLIFVWAGGTLGAIALATVIGTMETGRRY